MDQGRVGACFRTENKRRKFLFIINDVVRTKWSTYNEYLIKEKDDTACRFEKSKRFVRRALVRQKVLQQCMKSSRDTFDGRGYQESVYGRYGGKPVEAFSREIETFIAENHPKARRVRKIQKLMDQSIATGAILDKQSVSDKMTRFLERSITKMRLKRMHKENTLLSELRKEKSNAVLNRQRDQQRLGLPKLPVLTNNFYTGNKGGNSAAGKEGEATVNVLTLSSGIARMSVKDSDTSKSKGVRKEGRRGTEVRLPQLMAGNAVLQDIKPDTPRKGKAVLQDIKPDTPRKGKAVLPDTKPDTPRKGKAVLPDIKPDTPRKGTPVVGTNEPSLKPIPTLKLPPIKTSKAMLA